MLKIAIWCQVKGADPMHQKEHRTGRDIPLCVCEATVGLGFGLVKASY